MREKCFIGFILFLFISNIANAQTNDVSFLPKANAEQKDTFANRWGSMWNAIYVDSRINLDGEIMHETSLITAELKEGLATYIVFPSGGSGNDVYFYPITYCGQDKIEYDWNKKLKLITFNGMASDKERSVLLNDLQPGLYMVKYQSCHFGMGWVLEIKIAGGAP